MSLEKNAKKVTFSVPENEEAAGEESKTDKDEKPPNHAYLMEFLRRSFGLSDPPEQVLGEISLEGVARYISSGKCKNIITMVGAGISTSAGIPDFRSPDCGLYFQKDENGQNDFKKAFDIAVFKEDQQPFFNLAKKIWPGQSKPTPCHYFIRLLQEKGLLLRHYTQNIDSLEFAAGIDPELMVEAHGTFRSAHCIYCDEPYRQDWIEERVFSDIIPKCEDCNGPVKPDIVFFGNTLPDRYGELVEKDFCQCDLLIILGTSLSVQPFASLTSRVPETTPRLYINLCSSASGAKHPLMALFFGGGFKDVFWQGNTDDGCRRLAEFIGWKDELEEMIKVNTIRVEKDIADRQKAFAVYKASVASKKPPEQQQKETTDSESRDSADDQKAENSKSDNKTNMSGNKNISGAPVKKETTTTTTACCEKGKSEKIIKAVPGKSSTMASDKSPAALGSKSTVKRSIRTAAATPIKTPVTNGSNKPLTKSPAKSQTVENKGKMLTSKLARATKK
ncbi:hypothetical protein KUTeg_013760 [Tegillarca granosa]|uniref:Deacetylase sirtuin-type domain-containing protein n=1 Tax=Tegillarca granosa TaxID=220873 RepID=A0ABQ9EUM2_TEGGR|nr:hypothetical protein KUTeg_013760 [Tegillarca granosa]